MTIFWLSVYVCTTITGPQLSPMADDFSKTCRWAQRDMYVVEAKCDAAGVAEHGKTVYGDMMIMGSSTIIENHRCSPAHVN